MGGVSCFTGLTYALSYFRMLRMIVEEPDITPGAGAHTGYPALATRYIPPWANSASAVCCAAASTG